MKKIREILYSIFKISLLLVGILFLLGIISCLFASCDNFDEDEYMTLVQGQTTESVPITKLQTEQYVLLEDYTGWKCVNCPAAAALLEEMVAKHGERLVTMSVHAGSFAEPNATNNNLDLRTDYGIKWNEEFGFSSYPAGLINRTLNGSNHVFQKDEWDAKVTEILANTENRININMGAAVKDNKIIVSAEYVAVKDINTTLEANVFVLESDIHGVQFNSNSQYGAVPKIDDYTFNHVLRPNGLCNMTINAEQIANGEKILKNYAINIDQTWKLENCKVIIFLTDSATKEVIQVNEMDVDL